MPKPLKYLLLAIASVAFLSGVYMVSRPAPVAAPVVDSPQQPEQPVAGASNFYVVEGIPYTVSKTILTTDNTITLASFRTPDGRKLSMTNFGYKGYATLDPNNLNRLESVSFTGITQNGDGSATITGVSRGLDFITPYTASSTLQQTHLVGSQLILTNTSAFYGGEFAFLNNPSTIGAIWTFGSTTRPTYDAQPSVYGPLDLIDYSTLLSTSIQGAGTSSEQTMGIVQLANTTQVGSSLASSTTGAPLVIPNRVATTTPGTLCNTWTCIPALTNGKMLSSILDQTGTFTWTGLSTFNTGGIIDNASSTFTGTLQLTNTLINTNTGTSSFSGNLTVAKNASTTNLTISGNCAGCIIGGWATSTGVLNISIGAGNTQTVAATCAAGKRVVGGGYQVRGSSGEFCGQANGVCVTQSYPDTSSSWLVSMTCFSGSCGGWATATAMCVAQ